MWRVVLSPKWLVWHLLAVVAVAGCVLAAVWQWGRAGSALGSALNVGYGVQWPLFAVFFAYMWWRFLRLDLVAQREGEPEPVVVAVAEPADPAPWERMGGADNPFTRSPAAAAEPAVTEAEAPGLTEYNRMLAALAARDRESRG